MASSSSDEAAAIHPEQAKLDRTADVVIRGKLCGAMFLQHYSLGLWAVTLGSYITANTGDLGSGMFRPGFAGFAMGASAIGALVSPFVSGWLADRYIAAERLLVLLHFLGAAALAGTVLAENQSAFYLGLVGFFICYSPTYSLTNTLVFYHRAESSREFPVIRAWGTLGWVCAGISVGWLLKAWYGTSIEDQVTPLKLGIAAEIVAGLFCVFLPHTPPTLERVPSGDSLGLSRKSLLGRLFSSESLVLFRQPTMLISLAVAFLAALPTQFYYGYGNPFFNQFGLDHAAAKMTLGQVVEIGCMLLLPAILLRVGLKQVLLAGVAAWAVRYLCMVAVSSPSFGELSDALMYVAILLHGAAYTFVSISLQVHVNQVAGVSHRATAQGLLVIVSSGLGHLVGSLLAGITAGQLLSPESSTGWNYYWAGPAAISGVCWVLIAVRFPTVKT